MSADSGDSRQTGWTQCLGLEHLFRPLRMAAAPGKIVLALAGIILTVVSGIVLDQLWLVAGKGVGPDAITGYIAGPAAVPAAGAESTCGVFSVFARFEVSCVRDAIESVRSGRLIGPVRAGEPIVVSLGDAGGHPVRGAFSDLLLMGRGVVWLVTQHTFYALLWLPTLLLIWSYFGGAICRVAAIQFARDDSVSLAESLRHAKQKLWGGYFTAPLLPLMAVLSVGFILFLGGVVLGIPWFGDVVGGLGFAFALMGGLVIALLLTGTLAGGSLFWPTIAAEGSESFDAAARGIAYVYSKPLRAIWYAGCLTVLGSFGFLAVMFVVWLAAAAAHLFVGIGSYDFLLGQPNKLSQFWAPPTFETLHAFGGKPQGFQWVPTCLIAMWVLLFWGAAWAYLASFYFTGSTVAYFLLRRDVDGTDLGEVHVEERPQEAPGVAPAPATAPSSPAAANSDDIPLPVSGGPKAESSKHE